MFAFKKNGIKFRLISLLFLFCLTLLSVCPAAKAGQDDLVIIEDQALEEAVRAELDLPTGEITVANMESLKELKASDSGIASLDGLEYASNLEYLSLGKNQISDISPLADLHTLKNLHLQDNQLSDITPLEKLVNVYDLSLSNNQVSDISPLEGMAALKYLNLCENQITDISPLAELSNLHSIFIRNNEISEIPPLPGLTGLINIYLHDNQVNDISSLAKLDTLKSICLRNNQVSDISPLKDLNNLIHLYLSDNQVSDLSPLKDLTNLEALYLSNNQVSDISYLSEITKLKFLLLYDNEISDISSLSGMVELEELYLGSNEISDISPLSEMTNLEYLIIYENEIKDVSPLAGLNNLKDLVLEYNQINEIPQLPELDNLKRLGLRGNNISDISSLGELNALEKLTLSSNNINDISPLSKLTSLHTLWLRSNDIVDISSLSGLNNLEYLDLRSNQISDITSLADLSELEILWLNSNEIEDISTLTTLSNLAELWLHNNYINIAEGSPAMQIITTLQDEGVDVTYKPQKDSELDPENDLGDVNSDGVVNIKDVVLVIHHIIGVNKLSEDQKALADVNQDDQIDVLDSVLIMQYALDLIGCYTENYPDKEPGPEHIRLSADVVEENADENLIVEINIDHALGSTGGHFDLVFDPEMLKPISINKGEFVPDESGNLIDYNLGKGEGKLKALWLTPKGAELDSGVVCTVEFKLLDEGEKDFFFSNVCFSPDSFNVANNAKLSALELSEGILMPGFDPKTSSYKVDVDHDVDSIDIIATLADKKASLTIDGQPAESEKAFTVSLDSSNSETSIEIVVTAEDLSVKTYTIVINRLEDSEPEPDPDPIPTPAPAPRPDPEPGTDSEIENLEPTEDDTVAADFPESQVQITVESSESGTIQVARYSSETKASPEAMNPAGIYLDIEPSASLRGKPAIFTVGYSLPLPDDVEESTLKIYRWSRTGWELLPDQDINTEDKTITARVDGFSTFGVFGSPEPEIALGDVNGDNRIDVNDVTLIMQHIVGVKLLDSIQEKAADVNGDGRVDVNDVVLIMQYVLGLIDSFDE